MVKYLTKVVSEFRLENVEDVRAFEKERRQEAAINGYQVTGFAYTEKEIKEQGDVVDSYFVVKVTEVLNNAKDPDLAVIGFDYDFRQPEVF